MQQTNHQQYYNSKESSIQINTVPKTTTRIQGRAQEFVKGRAKYFPFYTFFVSLSY